MNKSWLMLSILTGLIAGTVLVPSTAQAQMNYEYAIYDGDYCWTCSIGGGSSVSSSEVSSQEEITLPDGTVIYP